MARKETARRNQRKGSESQSFRLPLNWVRVLAMVYPIWCVMPNDRLVFVDVNEKVCEFESDDEEAAKRRSSGASRTIGFQERGHAQVRLVPLEAVGQRFQFQYTSHLIFSHEKLLREVVRDKFCIEGDSELEPSTSELQLLKEKVHSGFIHDGLSIRHVGERDGSDVGFGLFADRHLSKGTFLGEYVGLVGSHSSFDPNSMQAYCCQYGTCEGSVHVNALEYGNVIRFINHSECPNAELSVVQFDGLPHIVCHVSRDVDAGSQIFIHYGASYWQNKSYHSVDIAM